MADIGIDCKRQKPFHLIIIGKISISSLDYFDGKRDILVMYHTLIKLTSAFLLFLLSFISFKSVGRNGMTMLHSILAFL